MSALLFVDETLMKGFDFLHREWLISWRRFELLDYEEQTVLIFVPRHLTYGLL